MYNGDGTFLASGSSDRTVSLLKKSENGVRWNAHASTHTRTLTGVGSSTRTRANMYMEGLFLRCSSCLTAFSLPVPSLTCRKCVFLFTFSVLTHIVCLLVTFNSLSQARIWDPRQKFRCIQTLEGHTASVYSISFRRGGEYELLSTASQDGTIMLWDPRVWRCCQVCHVMHTRTHVSARAHTQMHTFTHEYTYESCEHTLVDVFHLSLDSARETDVESKRGGVCGFQS